MSQVNRRDFLRVAAVAVGSGVALKAAQPGAEQTVWQIDPALCVQCGRCATNCVINPSAVKCLHSYPICGYCDLCGAYLQPAAKTRDTGAESQLCPMSAITRTHIEGVYYQYTIDEELCVGCGKCVKGCAMFGNGSLYLQVKRDLCVNCNDCAIARECPSGAMHRVPLSESYQLKSDMPVEEK